jgi:Ran GTPase-activating protein (RanGAP) involved in mRNA processing and transport
MAATTALAEMKNKVIEPDDKAYIEELMAENHQESYWQGWVILYTKANAASKKERILVLSNFRIFTIKKGTFNRSTRQSYAYFDLEEISIVPEQPNSLHLRFSKGEMDILSDSVVEIAQAALFGATAIQYGFPQQFLPKVDIPLNMMMDFQRPEPDTQDGLLATYLANCDYLGVSTSMTALDYIMTSFELQDRVCVILVPCSIRVCYIFIAIECHVLTNVLSLYVCCVCPPRSPSLPPPPPKNTQQLLDIGDCFHNEKKTTDKDIKALAGSLRFTTWFEQIIAANFTLGDKGVAALAPVLAVSPEFHTCVLVNVKAGKSGFVPLFEALANGKHGLDYLNISNNSIGDSGIKAMTASLKTGKRVIESLCVQGCGFSSKGFAALSELLCDGEWSQRVKVLDISDNSAGKHGSASLATYLSTTESLEQLYALRADLHLEVVLKALAENKQLCTDGLQTLNLSGNKLTAPAVAILTDLLRSSKSLTHIHLVNSHVNRAAAVEILTAAMENPHGVRFWIDLSQNDLGSKGGHDIGQAIASSANKAATLHTLVLNNCSLGGDGVTNLVQGLSGTAIHTLSINCNMKLGLLSTGVKDACIAIAAFVRTTPRLRELSIAGDDAHYLKNAALPICQCIPESKALRHIDLTRNRLGDEGIKTLADSISKTKSLMSFNAERNRFGIQGLRALHQAAMRNGSLTNWVIPMHDIQAIYKNSSTRIHKEMRIMVADFDTKMDQNAAAAARRYAAAEAKDAAVTLQLPVANRDALARRGTLTPAARDKRHSRIADSMFDALAMKRAGRAHDDSDGDGDIASTENSVNSMNDEPGADTIPE